MSVFSAIFRGLGGLLVIIGLALVAAAVAYPQLETRLIDEARTRAETELDGQIVIGEVTLRLPGRIDIDRVELDRGRWHLACDDVIVTVRPQQILRGARHAERIDVGRCALHERANEVSDATGDEATDPLDRLFDLADTVRSITDHLAIARLRIDAPEFESIDVDAVLSDVRIDPVGPALRASVVLRGDVQTEALRVTVVDGADPRVELRPNEPFSSPLSPCDVTVEAIDVRRELRVEAREVGCNLDQGAVTLSNVTVRDPLGAREIEIDGGRITTPGGLEDTIPVPVAASEPEEVLPVTAEDREASDDGNDELAGPSIGQRWMRLALDSVDRAIAASDTLRDLEWPDVGLDVTDLDVEFGGGRVLRIHSATLDRESRLGGSIALGGLAVRFGVHLRTARTLVFEAEGVDLAPLADLIGERARTGGVVATDATLTLDPEARTLVFEGDLQVENGLFSHPAVSPQPLEDIAVDSHTVVRLDAIAGTASTRVEGTFNGVPLDLEVDLEPDDESWTMAVDFGVSEETTCRDMYAAIPEGMLPNLTHRGMRFEGSAQPRLSWEYRLNDPWTFDLEAEGFPGTCAVTWIRPEYDPAQLNDPLYVHHITEGVTDEYVYCGPGTPQWTPLESVPSYVPSLMYLSEEIDFYSNPGISLRLINKGIRYSLERNRYAYGGSTVSQQLVKNLFLTREKTLSRKLEEVLIVWVMEELVTKDRILELYMNCVEFGPNIYGIQAASYYYFGVPPDLLTPLEAAYIAALKPSPSSGERYLRRGHSSDHGWWPERLQELLQRLVDYGGHIPQEEVDRYAPYVVVFPTSPNYADVLYERIPRPLPEPLPLLPTIPTPVEPSGVRPPVLWDRGG